MIAYALGSSVSFMPATVYQISLPRSVGITRVFFLGRNDGKCHAFQSRPTFSETKRKRNLHLLLDSAVLRWHLVFGYTGRVEFGIMLRVRITHMATKCRHCGSASYGHGCAYGPSRLHEHRDDEKHCEWCGSSSYGHGCAYGPDRIHRHGPGSNKCIWCGSTSNGSGCIYSPTHRHEK